MGPAARRVKLRTICQFADLPPGEGREFDLSTDGELLHLALFRLDDGVRAYRNACPHQGRSLSWAPGQFLVEDDGRLVCPHHGASFDLASGECVSGPCRGAALTAIEVSVRQGQVILLEKAGDAGT